MNSAGITSENVTASAPSAPAGSLRLRSNDINIWRATLDHHSDDVVQFMRSLLSPDEAERACDFHFERDRRRFIVGRGILRLVLGRYTGRPAQDLIFHYGPNGKPALTEPGEPIFFNVAHSDGLALFAFTRAGEIGVDVERIRDIPEWERIAAGCFSRPELARVRAWPESRRREEFFRAWTRQEALLKASGAGLGGARTTIGEEANPALRAPPAKEFSVYPLDPASGYAAALAIGAAGRWATCLTWDTREPFACNRAPRRGRRTRLDRLAEPGAEFP